MLKITKIQMYRCLNILLLVVLLGMSSVMYVSAHGGDGSLIHACVSNRNGAVRIVSAASTCDAAKETSLDWNIQGVQGNQGPQGPVGPMGPQGPAGGILGFYNRYTAVTLPGNTETSGQAYCDSGDYAISGGTSGVFGGGTVYMTSTGPTYDPIQQVQGWHVSLYSQSPGQSDTFVSVVCADITP